MNIYLILGHSKQSLALGAIGIEIERDNWKNKHRATTRVMIE